MFKNTSYLPDTEKFWVRCNITNCSSAEKTKKKKIRLIVVENKNSGILQIIYGSKINFKILSGEQLIATTGSRKRGNIDLVCIFTFYICSPNYVKT